MTGRSAVLVLLVALGGCSSTESTNASPAPSPSAVAAACRLPVVVRRFDHATGTRTV